MIRPVLLIALAAMISTGCTNDPTAGPSSAPIPSPEPSGALAAASSPPPPPVPVTSSAPAVEAAATEPPSATAKPMVSHAHGRVVDLSDKTVAGVAMGTAAGEAERRLRAALGRPSHADDEPGCNGEKGRQLIWGEGELVVWMVSEGNADAVLSGWSASRTKRFDYRFPYGTRLGESAAATQRRVPRSTGTAFSEGEFAESYVVETPERPRLFWIGEGPSSREPIYEVAFSPVGCD